MDWRCECMNERVDNRPQFIIGGRRSGKTVSIIKEASRTNGVIVCPTRTIAEYVLKTARKIGCSILQPITYDELFTYRERKTKNNNHYFDEYGIPLADALRRQLKVFERHNTKTIIIDESSIDSLNNILDGLKVSDMSGRELRFKIEVLGRNENND